MIEFPGLHLSFNIDRVAFTLMGKPVYWYGIIMAAAILAAVCYALHEAKRVKFSLDAMTDLIIYCIVFGIVGARLYYVIFNYQEYDSFWDIFKIWEGGIAVYGSIIGGVTAGYIYCRVKKLNFFAALDIAAIPIPIGQAIGRWGNFINREAFGRETTLPWRMNIYNDLGQMMSVHPTFLYESLWNIVGIIILSLYKKKKKFNGELFALYMTWYGCGRAWIEGLRTDSLYLGPLRISQIVAIVTAIAGIVIIIRGRIKVKNEIDFDMLK